MASAALSRPPRVTLVTPAHAAAPTLERMFASVAAQSLGRWEHIVVVSASDDATRDAVRNRAASDPRISSVEVHAATAGAARNAALRLASGEYVLFLDADDTIAPRHLEELVSRADSAKAEAVVGGYRRLAPDGRVIAVRRPRAPIGEALVRGPASAIHAMLFKRSLLERIGGFDPALRTNEDWDLCLRAAATGARFVPCDAITADYWTGHASLSSDTVAMMEDRLTVGRRVGALGAAAEDESGQLLDPLKTGLWVGALAIARGASPDGLLPSLSPLPPATADPALGAEALLDGFAVGFACRETEIETRLADRWEELRRFLAHVAAACDDEGLDIALLRRLEWELARLGPSHARRRIGQSEIVPLLRDPLRRLAPGANVEQVVLRAPFVRPRSRATLAFAPAAATGRRPLGLVLARLGRWLAERPRDGATLPGKLRDRALRAAALGRRTVRRLAGRPIAIPDEEPDAQSLTGDDRWEAIFGTEDPWNYHSDYECLKYERTIALLPEREIGNAIELACAEGLFTARLAPRVSRLTASDISPTALRRAERRCAAQGLTNVAFRELDFFHGDIGEGWDLIVSSEVLYYMDGPGAVADFAARVAAALAPGGLFLHAHAYEVTDSPERTGFDWGDPFAAETISRVFGEEPGLTLLRATETELYRIELYGRGGEGQGAPEVERLSARPGLHDELASDVVWNGAIVTRQDAEQARRYRLPVLLYHSVAEEGPAALDGWRVDPRSFEQQLIFLRRRGYRPVSLEEWEFARASGGALSGRPILITFDDGYSDFAQTAWPLLKRNGFDAHVFLVTGLIGRDAAWDGFYGTPAPLMDWEDIAALAEEGVGFGSHMHSHRVFDRLSNSQAVEELRRSREVLEGHLGIPVTSLAPPYGLASPAFEELAAMAGYTRLFRIGGQLAPVLGPRMRTPRIEITSEMTLEDFAEAISAEDMPDDGDRP